MNKQSPAYTIIFILAISVVFGFGISFVNYASLPLLKKNEALHKNRVMSAAFMLKLNGSPTAENYEAAVKALKPFPLEHEGKQIEAYKNSLNGDIGFIFSGFGVWDRITGIMVMSADLAYIRNIRFLDHKETPGLGSMIEEEWFTDKFKGLTIDWNAKPDRRVIIGQSPDVNAKNRVDAVTGATQTSQALMEMLNSELAVFKKLYEDYNKRKEK